MDNKDISKIPVSELTAENIDSLKGSAPKEAKMKVERDSKKKASRAKGSRLPLIITGIVLLIGVGVALYFIFRQPAGSETSDQDEINPSEVEIVWETGSETDEEAEEIVSENQAVLDDPDSSEEEKTESTFALANHYSTNGEFQKAQSLLDSIDRTSLTHQMTFNLYSAYAYLYECKGDNALREEYLNLSRAELEKLWEDEEDIGTEATEE